MRLFQPGRAQALVVVRLSVRGNLNPCLQAPGGAMLCLRQFAVGSLRKAAASARAFDPWPEGGAGAGVMAPVPPRFRAEIGQHGGGIRVGVDCARGRVLAAGMGEDPVRSETHTGRGVSSKGVDLVGLVAGSGLVGWGRGLVLGRFAVAVGAFARVLRAGCGKRDLRGSAGVDRAGEIFARNEHIFRVAGLVGCR